MKKVVLHRSVFAVVACIALAVSVLLTGVKVTPVQMDADIRDLLGAEAETSFCTFYEDLQVWYQETPVTGGGVTLEPGGRYQQLLDVVMELEPYMNACAAVTEGESTARLQEFNQPTMLFLMVTLNLMMNVETAGSYTFAAQEWSEFGAVIEDVVLCYQG